jgi:cytochrome c oxidase subunit 2
MGGCFVGFAISPAMGWWMPAGVSSHAGGVDSLFMIILWITTFFFVLTEALLVYFMWKYAGTPDGKPAVSAKADYPGFMKPLTNLLYDQHRVELAWTLVPSVILLYIAFAQVNTWANIKYESRKSHTEGPKASLQIGVSARQFEWRMRYPGSKRFAEWLLDKEGTKADFDSFARVPQFDDVHVVNELHLWQNQQVVVHLTTRDVIHSFNLPNFRVKQDALPGKMIPVWFKTRDPNNKDDGEFKSFNTKWDKKKGRYVDGINPATGEIDVDAAGKPTNQFVYDIPCAELCGWGHYRMIGRVYVHKDETDFRDWLLFAEKNSHNHGREAETR